MITWLVFVVVKRHRAVKLVFNTTNYSSCHAGILDWLRPTSQNPDGARLRGVLGIDTKTTRLNESRNGQEQFQDRRPRGPSFFTPLSSGGNIEALGITSGRVWYFTGGGSTSHNPPCWLLRFFIYAHQGPILSPRSQFGNPLGSPPYELARRRCVSNQHHVESSGGIMVLVRTDVVGRGHQNVGLVESLCCRASHLHVDCCCSNRPPRASQVLLRGSVKKLKLDDFLMVMAMVRLACSTYCT